MLRRLWPLLALLAGLGLIAFEYRRAGGVTSENVVWLLMGAVIVLLAGFDLVQRMRGRGPADGGRRRRDPGDDLPLQ